MAESVLPLAPAECTFDTLGLLTHGEFRCYQSPNPCLNLFTHGEFPRAKFEVADGPGRGQPPGVGTGRKRRVYKPEVIIPCKDEDIIALTLLMAAEDDDDDWW